MAAFDDGDARGTGRADGRHLSTVPSRLVSVWPAVSTTSSTHPGAAERIRWNGASAYDSLGFAILGRRLDNRCSQLLAGL